MLFVRTLPAACAYLEPAPTSNDEGIVVTLAGKVSVGMEVSAAAEEDVGKEWRLKRGMSGPDNPGAHTDGGHEPPADDLCSGGEEE